MKKQTNEPLKVTTTTPVRLGPGRKARTPSPHYSAQEKAQAVLAVWTERARPAEICRQLSIPWIRFSQWQDRAMEGMLQALESRVNLASGEALSPRLQALLHKQQGKGVSSRLCARLEKIQKGTPLQSDKVPQA